jgi:hypothetical protein
MSTIARFSLSFKPTVWSAVISKPISLPDEDAFLLSHCKIMRDCKIIQVEAEVKVVKGRGRSNFLNGPFWVDKMFAEFLM